MKTPAIFNVAIYLRLSKEDGDNEESDSISNQRELILNYISKMTNLKIYDEYIDDGYTGTNFNRPNFKRMIKDIEDKKVNMVITKTLSRFGRDYIDTGWYIEKYFPDNMVRYVAVLDKVDNFVENIEADFIPIKSVFNEKFCRETSIAVKRTKRRKMQEGFYSCTTPPFGYKKDPEEKGKLLVDEISSKIVKKIFELKAEGYTQSQIVDYLDMNNVITPLQYKDMVLNNYDSNSKKYVWTRSSVNSILCNRVYIGDTVAGKTQKISYKSKAKIYIKRNDCIVVRNTHEPIVSEEVFWRIHDTSKYGRVKKDNDSTYLLKGLVYCSECGKRLIYRKGREKGFLICRCHEQNKKLCSNDSKINYLKLEDEVIRNLKNIYDEYFEKQQAEENIFKIQTETILNDLTKQLNRLENENKKVNFKISTIYNQRLSNAIDEIEYKNLYLNFTNKRNDLITKIEQKKNEIDNVKEKITNIENKEKTFAEVEFFENKDFCKEDINNLINKIELYKNDVRIYYNFSGLHDFCV